MVSDIAELPEPLGSSSSPARWWIPYVQGHALAYGVAVLGLIIVAWFTVNSRPSGIALSGLTPGSTIVAVEAGSNGWLAGVRAGWIITEAPPDSPGYGARDPAITDGPLTDVEATMPPLPIWPFATSLALFVYATVAGALGLPGPGLGLTMASAVSIGSLEGTVALPMALPVFLMPLATAAFSLHFDPRHNRTVLAVGLLGAALGCAALLLAAANWDVATWHPLWLVPSVIGIVTLVTFAARNALRTVRAWWSAPAGQHSVADLMNSFLPAAQLSRLAGQDKERESLALRLHHDLLPTLYRSRRALESPTASRAEAVSQLDTLEGDLRHLMNERQLVVLRSGGLGWALEGLAREARTEGVVCQLEVASEAGWGRPPWAIEVAAYRIAQEALSNATRHADAHSVLVALKARPSEVDLHVVDDGVGDAGGVYATSPGHIGLLDMRERASSVRGVLTIEARKPTGTDVGFLWRG